MLKDVVLLQKRELEQRLKEPYIERELDAGRLSDDLINVITGPRRAGKSFFAMHAVSGKGSMGYLNFDDERLGRITEFDELLATVDLVYDKPEHLLIDEVQNIKDWELLVNRLQRQGYRLTITGSNAHLLGSELATHLTGRHVQLVLFPFSFAEYLKSMKKDLTEPEKKVAMLGYIETGGYPEPLFKNVGRRDYLSTLFRSILYKDIVVRHGIRSPKAIEDLAVYFMSNIAREFSPGSLAKTVGIKSHHTIEKYAGNLEESFLLFQVRRYSARYREQVRTNRKIYCVDNGMATSTSFRTSPDAGYLLENLVAISLQRAKLDGGLEFFSWKGANQEELDFVVKQGLEVTRLIQVCLDPNEPATRSRETRALLKASTELGCRDLTVVTGGMEGEEQISWNGRERVVKFVPFWKWQPPV